MVCDDLRLMLVRKHRAYGHNLLRHGERGIWIRIDDKRDRMDHMDATGISTLEPEGPAEAWLDIAGYAIQAVMMRRGWFELPMSERRSTGDSTQ
jgi:hypothetical protein